MHGNSVEAFAYPRATQEEFWFSSIEQGAPAPILQIMFETSLIFGCAVSSDILKCFNCPLPILLSCVTCCGAHNYRMGALTLKLFGDNLMIVRFDPDLPPETLNSNLSKHAPSLTCIAMAPKYP